MSFVTLAGIPFACAREGGASELAPERGGTVTRTFNGARRSTVRWKKRGWQFKSVPMLPADVTTLHTALDLGVQVAMSGDIVGNVPVTVDVEWQEQSFLTGTGAPNGFWYIVTLTVHEV